MLNTMRSRRIPAQHTAMSNRPNASIACCTSCSPIAISATLPAFATASPPIAWIAATTFSAGSLLCSPSSLGGPP